MKNKLRLIAVVLLMAFANCKTSNVDKRCEKIIDVFFNGIAKGKYQSTLTEFLAANKNINLKDSNMIDLKNKFDVINQYSGKYVGYDLIKKRNLNDDVVIYSYLVKYEKKFYRFVFVFYNVNGTPLIYRFTFDDTLGLELEESLKLYVN
jgi:hypothetical protein